MPSRTDAATLIKGKIDNHNEEIKAVMPLFNDNKYLGPPVEENEETEDDTSSEEEDTKKKKKKKAAEVNAVSRSTGEWYSDEWYESLPYPVIIDSGAAESVLPRDWCPQAALLKGEFYGKNYTAANGSAIKNRGEKIVNGHQGWPVAKHGISSLRRNATTGVGVKDC